MEYTGSRFIAITTLCKQPCTLSNISLSCKRKLRSSPLLSLCMVFFFNPRRGLTQLSVSHHIAASEHISTHHQHLVSVFHMFCLYHFYTLIWSDEPAILTGHAQYFHPPGSELWPSAQEAVAVQAIGLTYALA